MPHKLPLQLLAYMCGSYYYATEQLCSQIDAGRGIEERAIVEMVTRAYLY
jgi:hypothetical protein